jgi:hypothetical protein
MFQTCEDEPTWLTMPLQSSNLARLGMHRISGAVVVEVAPKNRKKPWWLSGSVMIAARLLLQRSSGPYARVPFETSLVPFFAQGQ